MFWVNCAFIILFFWIILGCIVWLVDNNSSQIFTSKKNVPKTNDNYVGIEVEFLSNLTGKQIGEKIKQLDFVQLVEDNSVRAQGYYGHELNILLKQDDLSKLYEVIKLIKGNSIVNETCGLHVHLDMRNRNVSRSFRNLFHMQYLLFSIVHKSRSKSRFCVKNKSQWMNSYDDRHFAINPIAYKKHKTIEVRLHHGTLDSQSIINYVKLLLKIVDSPKIPKTITSLKLSKNQRKFIDRQRMKYKVAA